MDDACIKVPASVGVGDFSLTVKRNCSISPQTLLWLLLATVLLSFGIATGFALRGAWLVFPFAGIEMLALAAALYVNGRHAADYERIVRRDGELIVEVGDGERVSIHRFHAGHVRVCAHAGRNGLRIALAESGRELEVGRHLDMPGRKSLARLLRARLAGSKAE
ncbi:MAG TPA: DUF2244 domain-containing protein [Burkholderiales bacterium]|nr:DUF2244 domain-containing protein [Burkholderiales bacterium]